MKVLNTPIGTFVTQSALLGSVLWGGSGLISAMKILPSLLSKAGASITLLGTTLKITTPQIYLIAAAVVALIATIKGISTAWKEAHPSLEDLNADIADLNTELQTNQERLEELNSIGWRDRTSEQNAEIQLLKEQNRELEKQIELRQQEAASTWGEQEVTDVEGYSIRDLSSNFGFSVDTALKNIGIDSNTFETMADAELAIEKLTQKFPIFATAVEAGKVSIKEFGTELSQIEYVQNAVTGYQELYNKSLEDGARLTADETAQMNEYAQIIIEAYEALSQFNNGTVLADAGLNDLYEQLGNLNEQIVKTEQDTDLLTNGIRLTSEQAKELTKLNPDLANSIKEVEGALYIQSEAFYANNEASRQMKEQILKDNIEWCEDTIEKAQQAVEALELMYATYVYIGNGEYLKQYKYDPEALALAREYGSTIQENRNKIASLRAQLNSLEVTSSNTTSTQISAEKTLTDVLEEQLEVLDHQAYLLEKNGADATQLVQIYKQAQAEIHAVAEEYRSLGYAETSSEIMDLQKLWWGYQDKITGVYDDINDARQEAAEEAQRAEEEAARAAEEAARRAEEAWREAMQERIDDLQEQADAWETAFQVVADKAQEEIDALEEQKDTVEEYYNSKIDALQEQNDELDRQIELEKAAMNLASAESQKMLVYKDGRFQYVQNAQAISEAQEELERLEREEALRQETENLEQLKDQAIAAIDEQIKYWEKYKDEWGSVVQDYQDQQDLLLAEQVLGIQLEGDNWELRLGNLQSYVDRYISIMEQLQNAQNELNEGWKGQSAGGSGSGGNWSSVTGGFWGSGGGGGREEYPAYDKDQIDRNEERYEGQSYVVMPSGQTTSVTVVDGKLQQTYLPEGTILRNPNGQEWLITGGTGTDDDPYTSELLDSNRFDNYEGAVDPSTGMTAEEFYDKLYGGGSYAEDRYEDDDDDDVVYIDRDDDDDKDSGGSIHDKVEDFLNTGHSGNVFIKPNARGTLSSEGGIRLVGEEGPELRVLNQGDGILPAEATRNLMEWAQFSPKQELTTKTTQFFFDKLILPNVKDLFSLQEELKHFNQFSFQH